jgi:hypothetical protein
VKVFERGGGMRFERVGLVAAVLLVAGAGCPGPGHVGARAGKGFEVVFAGVGEKRCPESVKPFGAPRDCGQDCIGVSRARDGKAIVQVRGTDPAVKLPLKPGSANVQPRSSADGRVWFFDLSDAKVGDRIQFGIEVAPGCGLDPIIIVDE